MANRALFLIQCVYVFILFIQYVVGGSVMTFTSSIDSFQPSLTPSLSLRCSANGSNDAASPGGLVGRSLSTSGGEIQHVTSIVIMRDGIDVAAVSPYIAAHSFDTMSNVSVKGGVADTPGERGYLEIEFRYPSENVTGEYECQIGGVSNTGHTLVLSKLLVLKSRVPTIMDLVAEMHELKQTVESQQATIRTQQLLLKDQQANITNVIKTVSHNTNAIQHLSTELQQSRQLDNGTIKCGHSNGWTLEAPKNYFKVKSVHQPFNATFTQPPLVHLSVSVFFNTKDVDTWYTTELVQVQTDSFDMKCKTWYEYPVKDMWVSWVAIAV